MSVLIALFAVLFVFFTMSWWMPRAWYRSLLYPNKRPNALSRRLNALSAWAGARGVAPSLMVTIETRGRRSGRPSRVPLIVVEVEGERYLVSMLGGNVDWIRNAEAAGGEAVLLHGSGEHVRLEEVAASERAPILKAYLHRAPGARPHFDIGPSASLEDFARIASLYPVFWVRPRNSALP